MEAVSSQLVLQTAKDEGWKCNIIWDGEDFTPCFRDRYLMIYPVLLIIIIGLWIASRAAIRIFSKPTSLASSDSVLNESEFSSFEFRVILDSATSDIFPSEPSFDTSASSTRPPILGKDARESILKWRLERTRKDEWWSGLKFWVGIIGALIWFNIEIARAVKEGAWINVVFPAWIAFLAAFPGPITPLITMHIPLSLLLFRSSFIQHTRTPLSITCVAVEIAFWFALISIPYKQNLDKMFQGGTSKGGSSSGSFGTRLPKHCEEPASPFSRATYSFLLPLLFKHYFTPITVKDIPAIREDDSSAASAGAFREYQSEQDRKHFGAHGKERVRSLGSDLLRHFSSEVVAQAGWSTSLVFLEYLPPIGLRLFLQYVQTQGTQPRSASNGALYVAMMTIGQTLSAMVEGQCNLSGRRLSLRVRSIVVTEVFAKALRRRDTSGSTAQGKTVDEADTSASEGKINNYMTVDAANISNVCAIGFFVFSSPLSIVVNLVLLCATIGWASIAGLVALGLMTSLQSRAQMFLFKRQLAYMSASDKRVASAKEAVSYIKLIKFHAWEHMFFQRMDKLRQKELGALKGRFVATVIAQLTTWAYPVLVTGSAFAVHSLVLKRPLTADTAFASLVLFNKLRFPLAMVTFLWTSLVQAYHSCNRIQEYLDEPDTDKFSHISVPEAGEPQIGFSKAILTHATAAEIEASLDDESMNHFALGDLNIEFPVGQLSIICGHVGSGKTTLVQGLLGEISLFQGKVFLPCKSVSRDLSPIESATGLSDTVAYCAQTPWLVGASIKENILFGTPYSPKRYNEVVTACALEKDFEIFEDGDETEVGEKGTTCSGGQKARIALARAIYSPAKTIILDDVLSAVDAQTAKHIYDYVLKGTLTKGRTVILVTHQVNMVSKGAELIIMLEDGAVLGQGSPFELMREGLLDLDHGDGQTDVEMDDGHSVQGTTMSTSGSTLVSDDVPSVQAQLDGGSLTLSVHTVNPKDGHHDDGIEIKTPDIPLQPRRLVEDESQSSGATSLATYTLYFKSMGGWIFLALLAAFFASNGLQVFSNFWIKLWANADDNGGGSYMTHAVHITQLFVLQQASESHSTWYYLSLYLLISAFYLAVVGLRIGVTLYGALKASRSLYDRLFKRLLGAKMRFYDITPSGRIMNRLTKDVSTIDQEAGEILLYLLDSFLTSATVLVVVSISTPAFIVTLAAIIVLYCVIGSLYVATNREIKRIESVTRSPIMITFSDVLVGVSTIRSYGDSARFIRKIFQEIDQNTRASWYMWQVNNILDIWCKIVGALVTVFASIFALRSPNMSAGAAGLSISYALTFTESILWVVKMYANAEMTMNSVERVAEYLDVELEENEDEKGLEPPACWPSRDGSVVVENLSCSYAPQLEPVLKDVSFTIGPREKIGICGRTGCGKSTLALSFFRFLHQSSGRIIIDGQDISKLSLSTLRSRLTILPQEAQLFSGTIRENLDPLDQHDDVEIWDALSQCGLITRSGTPSRAASRRQSRQSLRAGASEVAGKVITKQPSARNLLKKASKKLEVPEDDEQDEEEMVIIRTLDDAVADGGKNFSQGQRQLLALSRGLLKLKSSSFLIMDESTANLDQSTDATIQGVLREGLGDTQMLVIAHRLMTICGLDKILVLDQGRVVEFGTPWELITKEGGIFNDLCKQSGDEKELQELAKQVHDTKHESL